MQRKHMLQYLGNAAYYSFVPSLEEGSFSVSSCSTLLSADLSTMLDLSEPSSSAVAQRSFILTEGNGKRLVRLMADEIATGSGTKVSKRKLKRLQVSRCSWFILSVKSTSLFSHLQRIGVVHFHSYSTANSSLVTQFETATVQFIKNQPWSSRVLRSTSYVRDVWD